LAILILGDPSDPHVEKVSSLARNEGSNVIIFHRFAMKDMISLSFVKEKCEVKFVTPTGTFSGDEVSTVWVRLKPVALSTPSGSDEWLGQDFAQKEWQFVLHSLQSILSHAVWVNPIPNQNKAAMKPFQLFIAQKLGMAFPVTEITNNPDCASDIFLKFTRVIYKTLGNYVFPPDKYIYTSEIDISDVLKFPERIQRAPGIFQAYIEKDFELRVTIVGEEIFATKIKSQKNDKTKIDWRKSQIEPDMYEPYDLDNETSSKLIEFHDMAGLVYAAYDFVVPPTGKPVFLECNPAGQWLWMEDFTNQTISKSLADLLVRLDKA
jgi:hypothetical protein